MIARLILGRSQGETYLEVEGERIANMSFYRCQRKDDRVIAFDGAIKEMAAPSEADPWVEDEEDEEQE